MNPILAALTMGSTGNHSLDAMINAMKLRMVAPEDPITLPRTAGSVADLGEDQFTDERMYGGMSAEDIKRHRALNATLMKRGEVYHPKYKKVYKLGSGNQRLTVTQDEMLPVSSGDMVERAIGPTVSMPDAMRTKMLADRGLMLDPKSGDIVPMKKKRF